MPVYTRNSIFEKPNQNVSQTRNSHHYLITNVQIKVNIL